MGERFDIIIRRARLRAPPTRLTEIGVKDGRIAIVSEHIGDEAVADVDAKGNLVTKAFVNPHLHLCIDEIREGHLSPKRRRYRSKETR